MSKYLTEFDEIQAAFRKVRLDENCMVYRNGMLLEHQDTYNKIQKLLNAPEMSEAHRYLYDLDVECLSEDEIERVDKLFDLGVKKGYIDNSFQEELDKSENPDAVIAAEEPEKAAEVETTTETPAESRNVPIPCWTILYSATKNGETKCGECYSNAISVSAAKADCLAKLERFGYGNVSILAIEAGDSDCAKMTEDEMRRGRTDALSITEAEEDDAEGEDISDGGDDVRDTDAGDDTEDDSGDAGGDDVGDDDAGGDDSGDDSGDDTGDDSGDAGGDDSGDDSGDDTDSDGNDDADAENGDGEDGDGDDSDEGKELSDEEKSALKDEYKSTFREVMLSCKFEGRSFIDLTIPEKTQFFSALNIKWKKNDPKDFMSEEEQDQLESIVVNPQ